jgi:hypothetical protein
LYVLHPVIARRSITEQITEALEKSAAFTLPAGFSGPAAFIVLIALVVASITLVTPRVAIRLCVWTALRRRRAARRRDTITGRSGKWSRQLREFTTIEPSTFAAGTQRDGCPGLFDLSQSFLTYWAIHICLSFFGLRST